MLSLLSKELTSLSGRLSSAQMPSLTDLTYSQFSKSDVMQITLFHWMKRIVKGLQQKLLVPKVQQLQS